MNPKAHIATSIAVILVALAGFLANVVNIQQSNQLDKIEQRIEKMEK